ncbi:hypothetical protein WICPIJ_000895 [Wickerhamomyces pijperi]|uniref:GATA-type domain-containing protein n=1 Tax=Wickerhamomyces pijperi TaxID=599730 RepID=A0A9P8QF35_WICPI|nr:hypothetical protein WICPIJ_000895 [Wickerhamomyces pijperi]
MSSTLVSDASANKVKLPSISMLTNTGSPSDAHLLSPINPVKSDGQQEANIMEQTADIFLIAHQQEEQRRMQSLQVENQQQSGEEQKSKQEQHVRMEYGTQHQQHYLPAPPSSGYQTPPVPMTKAPYPDRNSYTHQPPNPQYPQTPQYTVSHPQPVLPPPQHYLAPATPYQRTSPPPTGYPQYHLQPHQQTPPGYLQQHSSYYPQAQYPSYYQAPVNSPRVENYNPSIHLSPRYLALQYNRQKITKPNSSRSSPSNIRFKAQKRQLYCQRCGITETPEWRKGPNGARTLCNACGLYHAKVLKKEGPEAAREIINNFRVFKKKPDVPVSIEAAMETRKANTPVSVSSLHNSRVLPSVYHEGTDASRIVHAPHTAYEVNHNPYYSRHVQAQATYDTSSYTSASSSSSSSSSSSYVAPLSHSPVHVGSRTDPAAQTNVILPPSGQIPGYNMPPLRTPF